MSQPSITNCPFTFGLSVYGWYIRSVYRFHYRLFFTFLHHVCLIQVTIALRFHLFPFRTEKLSSVTPMVLRNSGRVGSRRFFRERSPCIGRCRGFLVLGLFCLPCLILALFCLLCFSLFCLLSWGQQIFSGDYSYTCEVFLFLCFQDIISYHIIPVSHHISGKHLLLCLSVLISEKNSVSYVGRSFIYVSLNRF